MAVLDFDKDTMHGLFLTIEVPLRTFAGPLRAFAEQQRYST
jgi:hypothetical protein